MNEGSYFTNKGKNDSKDSGAANNPRAVHTGNGHDAHIFPIRRIRCRTDKARKDVGQAVGKEAAVQARVLDQIAADDITGDKEMP